VIEVRSVTKIFAGGNRGAFRAVDNVSFTCLPGQIYGLLGANGAGKTTTLRVLATLLHPTSGSASVNGFDVRKNAEGVRASIGYLAASTALYGRLTARELLTYFGQLNGMDEAVIATRVSELAEILDMRAIMDKRCETLSTGMQQKVSISRALVHDPAVMVFDEPTIGLDVMSSRALIRFVRECRDAGKTVIYSTHTMHEVDKLCDRVGIIDRGRIVAEGALEALREEFQ
jgi:sodium transport system ATP-binding protein